jgi:steroid delta-isomerase-like uncharacterized protein
MSAQKLIQLADEQLAAFNSGNLDRVKRYLGGHFVYDEAATGRTVHGGEAFVELLRQWKEAMPDVRGVVTHTVVSGQTVWREITWEGTHSGPLRLPGATVPPSGRRIVVRAAEVLVFEGEQVRETRHYFDMLAFLQQAGAAPQQTGAGRG